MIFTPDGSKMILCFGSYFSVYDFDSNQGVVVPDVSSKLSFALPLDDNQDEIVIEDVSITDDGEIIALCDNEYIYSMSLDQNNTEKKLPVCKFPLGSIVSLTFLPYSANDEHHPLYVTYGKYSTTLQVNAKEGFINDASILPRCFAVCDDDTTNALISENTDLLHKRDRNGRNLAELAVDNDRAAVLRQILDVEPSMAWSSQDVIRYVALMSKEDLVETITVDKSCAFSFTDPGDLDIYTHLIPELTENGSIDIIYFLLQAGSPDSASGFVPGKQMWKQAFLNHRGVFRRLSNLLIDKERPCDGSQVIPETSKFPNNLEIYGRYANDKDKRILLNASRVLLPYLSKHMILDALISIDSSSDQDNVGKNVIPQHLKPFRSESLQASIEAAWYSWAGPMFLRRAMWYFVWMVCIICLEYIPLAWIRIPVLIIVGLGWVYYFFVVEMKQLKRKKTSLQYFFNFWNIWQISTLVLVFAYVCLNIVDVVLALSSRTTVLNEDNWRLKWFHGLVRLFTLSNFLYYFRGIKRASWILYALGVLVTKMFVFLIILLWIIVATCFHLTKVKNAFDAEDPIHIFTDTYVTAVFGSFDSAEFCSYPYKAASGLVLIYFILLSLVFVVFMNAMIAFISEEFANILDYQSAILAREMACLIVDMYDTMNDELKIREIEDNHKWVYKLYKQADLDKIGNTDSDADGRRATKKDLQGVVVRLKKDIANIRKENTEMRKEVVDVRKENAEIKSSLERIEEEMKSMKSGVDKIVSMFCASN